MTTLVVDSLLDLSVILDVADQLVSLVILDDPLFQNIKFFLVEISRPMQFRWVPKLLVKFHFSEADRTVETNE